MVEARKYIAEGMPQIDDIRAERLGAFCIYVSVLPWFNADVLHKLLSLIHI